MSDEAVLLEVVLVEPRPPVGQQPLLAHVEALKARYGARVQYRTSEGAVGLTTLRACAAEADLVVLGLSPNWGLDVERGGAEPARLLAEFPASLLVLHAQA